MSSGCAMRPSGTARAITASSSSLFARRGLGAEESALQIHVEHEVPVALAHIEKRHAGIDAGVVDEHVEPPELAGDLRDHRLGARRPRHVGLDERGAPAGSADLLEKL